MTVDRRGRMIATAVVVGAVVAPVVLDADSFPLSTYPMYSQLRTTEVAFATAQAVDGALQTRPLSLGIIGASDDPLIVAGELRAAIRSGRAADRCREIADRWRTEPSALESDAIEVVTEVHDVVLLAAGSESLIERTVHARCDVEAN
jgi:hypothetical protein